ncbi:helix-turn-helix transcriptional regulator [Athalassotoga sp.]|uniref:helix-turn-helix transcriptional regulator n=2 Tax=Athalassotoga sp. TaxID=2022597 RepID=UPI003CFEBD83
MEVKMRQGRGFGRRHGMRVRFIGPFLLLALYKEPSYGYQLMDKLREFGFEEYLPDQTAIYKMLRSLEEKGLITSRWDTSGSGPARHIYEITQAGIETLDILASEIKDNIQIYKNFLEIFENVRRADDTGN